MTPYLELICLLITTSSLFLISRPQHVFCSTSQPTTQLLETPSENLETTTEQTTLPSRQTITLPTSVPMPTDETTIDSKLETTTLLTAPATVGNPNCQNYATNAASAYQLLAQTTSSPKLASYSNHRHKSASSEGIEETNTDENNNKDTHNHQQQIYQSQDAINQSIKNSQLPYSQTVQDILNFLAKVLRKERDLLVDQHLNLTKDQLKQTSTQRYNDYVELGINENHRVSNAPIDNKILDDNINKIIDKLNDASKKLKESSSHQHDYSVSPHDIIQQENNQDKQVEVETYDKNNHNNDDKLYFVDQKTDQQSISRPQRVEFESSVKVVRPRQNSTTRFKRPATNNYNSFEHNNTDTSINNNNHVIRQTNKIQKPINIGDIYRDTSYDSNIEKYEASTLTPIALELNSLNANINTLGNTQYDSNNLASDKSFLDTNNNNIVVDEQIKSNNCQDKKHKVNFDANYNQAATQIPILSLKPPIYLNLDQYINGFMKQEVPFSMTRNNNNIYNHANSAYNIEQQPSSLSLRQSLPLIAKNVEIVGNSKMNRKNAYHLTDAIATMNQNDLSGTQKQTNTINKPTKQYSLRQLMYNSNNNNNNHHLPNYNTMHFNSPSNFDRKRETDYELGSGSHLSTIRVHQLGQTQYISPGQVLQTKPQQQTLYAITSSPSSSANRLAKAALISNPAASSGSLSGSSATDLHQQPQTLQIAAVPSLGFANQQQLVVGTGGLFGNAFNGGFGNGLFDSFGRPTFFLPTAERRQTDWSTILWALIAVISLPMLATALFVPMFLKTIVMMIRVLQAIGVIVPIASMAAQLSSQHNIADKN